MILSGVINRLLEKRGAEITTPGPNYKIRNPLVSGYVIKEQKMFLYKRAIKNCEWAYTEEPVDIVTQESGVIRTEIKPGPNKIRLSMMTIKIDDVELIDGIWYVQRDVDWDKVINIDTIVNGRKVKKPFIIFNTLKYQSQPHTNYYEATPAYWDNYGLHNQFGPVYIIAEYDATPHPLYIAQEYLKTPNVFDDTLQSVNVAMAEAISRTSH